MKVVKTLGPLVAALSILNSSGASLGATKKVAALVARASCSGASHSSANQLIFQNGKKLRVYRRNNNGPKTLSSGTPDTTLTSLLLQPSTITCCDRFDRNSVNIDRTEPPIPTEQSVWRMPTWLTLSKAALKSICTIRASCPLSNALCSVWDTHRSTSQVHKPFR